MVERKLTCAECGSVIETWENGDPITGCPHHNPHKRSHLQNIEVEITLVIPFQWEPGCGWVASCFGLLGEGESMEDAVCDLQAKIRKAGW